MLKYNNLWNASVKGNFMPKILYHQHNSKESYQFREENSEDFIFFLENFKYASLGPPNMLSLQNQDMQIPTQDWIQGPGLVNWQLQRLNFSP